MTLALRTKESCRWDLVSLGEVMLRFDPGDRRIWTARNFEVSEGGGEYNVARGLKRCFGLNTAVVTAIADNPIGESGYYPDSGKWKVNKSSSADRVVIKGQETDYFDGEE